MRTCVHRGRYTDTFLIPEYFTLKILGEQVLLSEGSTKKEELKTQ